MLWFVCLLNYADRQAIFSVFPVLKSQLRLSDVQLGYVASSFMWVYALAAPLAGLIGDRFQRKTIILGGLLFWSSITIATALSTTYWQLVAFRALEGLGEAFYFPASMSMLSAYHERDTRSRAMSWHQSSVYAGTILGGAAAGWLADVYGWRTGFCVFGAAGVALGLALFALLDEPEQPRTRNPEEAFNLREAWEAIFRAPMVLVLMAVFIGANFVAMIFLTWLPSYLTRAFGMSLSMAGLNATVYLQIASILGVLCGGILADRLALRHRAGRMLTQALGLFAGVPFLLASGWTLSVTGFIVAMTGFGFFKGIYDANIWASLHDVVPVVRRATAVGVMNSIGWLGGGVAPVAIAAASGRFGMRACLSATSVIYGLFGLVLTIGIMLYMRDHARREEFKPALMN
ncbi:MAG TPA: MFS transporter [Bryobacteraceae bacterium]|jgi:MFS family permease|nr:MFS transporter [Bryobacteraceae bacterium]